ncbi:sensor histidine kinase [Archangium lansingense]|uniref:histidine kinase n=1 Tax=Archangium lansingense TaxID=2995310 RepID=A0ABT4ACX9_9BACT|nr:HAMP domain-containing sensor histidine kinase [Archangium lansinium]MCY1078759.1 HAMP domain-containing sensor histidine kinase [Archangium lansinium]
MRALGVLMLWLMVTPLAAAEPENTVPSSEERKRGDMAASARCSDGGGDLRELELWGRYRWAVSAVVGGGLLQAVLIVVLLLERRRRRGAQRLNLAVLDSLPGAVAILDKQGAVLRASAPSAQREGLGALSTQRLIIPGSSYLQSLQKLAHAGELETAGAATLLEDVYSGRVDEGMVEFRGHRADTWFELRARRLELPGGGAVVTVVDATPRRRAELEARRAQDERAHMERVAAVGELGASIAHELNQPLSAILTNAETAQRLLRHTQADLSLLRELIDDIIADDKRAGEIIRRTRALLKKDQGPFTSHDFNALVRQVAQLAGNDVQLRGATLTLQLADTPLPVRGDGVQLQQVVLNLIINALDAVSPCQPGERQVWVRTLGMEGRVELEVEDTGVGLSPEVRKRLFEPFFTTKPAGLGMGLSISRSILEVHQGRLQPEPRPGRGTLFRCSLPSA